MDDPVQPIQIQISLTAEQQALIQRLSGQYAQVLELVPDADRPASGGRTRAAVPVAAVGREWDSAPAVGTGLKLSATRFGRRYSFVTPAPFT